MRFAFWFTLLGGVHLGLAVSDILNGGIMWGMFAVFGAFSIRTGWKEFQLLSPRMS